MAQVGLTNSGFVVQTHYSERDRLKALNARWLKQKQKWSLPLDAPIETAFSRDELDTEVQVWLQARKAFQQQLLEVKQQQDTTVKYPQELDPYQRVGVRFLSRAKRAILADDVGLGKTAQAIRAVKEVADKRTNVLVIAKKSLLLQWQKQFKQWAPEVSTTVFGSKGYTVTNTVTIMNYEALLTPKAQHLFDKQWQIVIADEVQAIKNRKSKRTAKVWQLAHKAEYVWLLSATITPNGPWELWPLLHAVDPDYYSSFWRFAERYCNLTQHIGTVFLPGLRNKEMFEQQVAPIILRRDKQLLNLPALSYEKITVAMLPQQERIYRELQTEFIARLTEDRWLTTSTTLAQLTRLRQILCTPALVGGPDVSGKTDALLELLEDLCPKHKVLIFSAFTAYIDNLLPKLQNYCPAVITGKQSLTERREAEQRFETENSCRILIGSIRAMAEGLNLQSASAVIFTDQDWTPAFNEQAIGRAHRRGQTKPVHVISFTAADTVEEHVQDVLQKKNSSISDVYRELVRALRR